jgi:hypothetical protein
VVDPDERPYYVLRYDDATYSLLARRAGAAGERGRERLYRDAMMLHAAGELRDASFLRLLASAREPLDSSVWTAVADEYRRMDLLVRDAPEARALAAMQRAALGQFVLRYDRFDSSEAGPLMLGYESAAALAASGERVDGTAFRDDYARLLDGATTTNMQTPSLIAMLSAADATEADVQRTEARLRTHPATPSQAPFEETFLENVGSDALARRVLSDVVPDRRLTGDDPSTFLFTLGRRHPGIAFTYLRDHLSDVERGVPPSQQAWNVSIGVANELWPAAAPRVLERFLRSRFPNDRATVDMVVGRIEQSWSERRELRAALRAIGPAMPTSASSSLGAGER